MFTLLSTLNQMKNAGLVIGCCLVSSIVSQPANASEDSASGGASRSVGASIGSQGLGFSFTQKTNWHWVADDQLQLRITLSGLETDDLSDIERNHVKYDSDIELKSAQVGLDWYPMTGGFTRNLFVSAGLSYHDFEFDGTSKSNQAIQVGSTNVPATANVRLVTSVEQSTVSPYLSVGWGNRIRSRGGFSFFSEVGVMGQANNSDVVVTTKSPTNLVSAADLESERKAIEDELDGLIGFAGIGVSYQF